MRQPELRSVPGLLSAQELQATVDAIAAAQQPTGSLPWPDGHTDAWDHVECAMALTLGGRFAEARAAYEWLKQTQAPDGSWAMSYDELEIIDSSVDSNQCAYIAVGVWQWWTLTADSTLPVEMWPFVRRALDFVVDLQLENGAISWGRSPEGDDSSTPWQRTPKHSWTRATSRWTGTTQCSVGHCTARPQRRCLLATGTSSSSPILVLAVSRTDLG